MKKIALSLLFAAALFQSCLDINKSGDRLPIQGGLDIFNYANPSNFAALEPITLSVKLNALLTQRENLGGDTPLDAILVGEEKMSDLLFGKDEVTFETAGLGVWELTFKGINTPKADYRRTGAMRVHTGNKLLQELPETSNVWSVENVNDFETGNEKPYILITDNNIGLRISIPSETPEDQYIIAGAAQANTWSISSHKVRSYMSNKLPKNIPWWGIAYELKLTASDLSFEGLKSAKFELNGSASGNVPNYERTHDILMTYDIEDPIKIDIGCKLHNDYKGMFQYGGAVRITIDEPSYTDYFDKGYFPTNNTKWSWTTGAESCTSRITVAYNGNTTIE